MVSEREQLFSILLTSYKTSSNVTVETIKVYSMMLSDIPTPALKVGVMKCISSCKFFPTIAEIREASQAFVAEVSGTKEKDYTEAWDEVWYHMQHTGAYKAPKWSTENVEKAVNNFGWVNICVVEEDKLSTLRAQFRDVYNAIIKRSIESNKNKQMFGALSESARKQLNVSEKFIKELAEKKNINLIE